MAKKRKGKKKGRKGKKKGHHKDADCQAVTDKQPGKDGQAKGRQDCPGHGKS